jgi:hypothetical protein
MNFNQKLIHKNINFHYFCIIINIAINFKIELNILFFLKIYLNNYSWKKSLKNFFKLLRILTWIKTGQKFLNSSFIILIIYIN